MPDLHFFKPVELQHWKRVHRSRRKLVRHLLLNWHLPQMRLQPVLEL